MRGVDQHQARRRLVGNALEQRTDQVALGVDDANPAARLDVFQREVQQERALSAAGRAEDVNVLAAIRLRDGDGRVPDGVSETEGLPGQRHGMRRSHPGRGLIHCDAERGEVKQAGQLFGNEHGALARGRPALAEVAVEGTGPEDTVGTEPVAAVQAPV